MVVFVLLCIIFMLIVCIYLYQENQKLKEQISNFETKITNMFEKNIPIATDKENIVPLKNISQNKSLQKEKNNTISQIQQQENKKVNNLKEQEDAITSNKYIAKKKYEDIYELNLRASKNSVQDLNSKNLTNKIDEDNTFEPLDFISKKEIRNINTNKEYLKEVSNNLNNSVNPSIIELTDYEKEEENQAVISYQELLNLKENKNNEKISDVKFIDDLKEFKNLLDKNN